MPRALATRLASVGARPNVLVWQPEPPDKGQASAARRMAGGVWLLEGRLAEAGQQSPWDIDAPDQAWQSALHAQKWLDDAAAANDPQIWKTFSGHVWDWLDRYATGTGPGWAPEIVAHRLIRWIAYSTHLLQGQDRERSTAFFHALGTQSRFLGWRWQQTPERLARVEALTGLLYANLSLEGSGSRTDRTISDLGRNALRIIQPDGSIASRNPEELARVLALLSWSSDILNAAGMKAATGHLVAIRRAAPVVRALTNVANTLPRFHGGRSGTQLPLKRLNATVGKGEPGSDQAPMGYVRMRAEDALLMMDAAQAPTKQHAISAHSSALAFEFHDATQPVIVNCGTGSGFGSGVAIAARRAEAHSTVELGDRGPGQLIEAGPAGSPAVLSVHGTVAVRVNREPSGPWALAESRHYVKRLGLQVERRIHLSTDGKHLSGEDTALATDAQSRGQIAKLFPTGKQPCPMRIRFHLHPDVTAAFALSGRGVSLTLPDGTLWMLKTDTTQLEILPSQYFDETRPQPRATSQIVATTAILDYWGRVIWSLERLHERGAR